MLVIIRNWLSLLLFDFIEKEKGQITLEDLLTRTAKDEKTKKLLKTIQKLSKRQDELSGEASKSSSGSSTPKSRGRPKGSKNRQKDEPEKPKLKAVKRANSSSDVSGTPKKKIKGSKCCDASQFK